MDVRGPIDGAPLFRRESRPVADMGALARRRAKGAKRLPADRPEKRLIIG